MVTLTMSWDVSQPGNKDYALRWMTMKERLRRRCTRPSNGDDGGGEALVKTAVTGKWQDKRGARFHHPVLNYADDDGDGDDNKTEPRSPSLPRRHQQTRQTT
jgi:hypothetical protein